jgi:hypothetical protein
MRAVLMTQTVATWPFNGPSTKTFTATQWWVDAEVRDVQFQKQDLEFHVSRNWQPKPRFQPWPHEFPVERKRVNGI